MSFICHHLQVTGLTYLSDLIELCGGTQKHTKLLRDVDCDFYLGFGTEQTSRSLDRIYIYNSIYLCICLAVYMYVYIEILIWFHRYSSPVLST